MSTHHRAAALVGAVAVSMLVLPAAPVAATTVAAGHGPHLRLDDVTPPVSNDDVPTTVISSQVPFTVTLTAEDDAVDAEPASGVAEIYYEIGTVASPAVEPTTSSTPVSVAQPELDEGEYVRYFATDMAGNAETPHNSNVLTVEDPTEPDTTPPTTTDDVPTEAQTSPVVVTLTATDDVGGSGVARIRYSIGTAEAPPADPNGPDGLTYDADARPVLYDDQLISYSATDNADNTEATKTSPAASVVTTIEGAPAITGQPVIGETLSASTPGYTPATAETALQWLRLEESGPATVIDGATGSTYEVSSADYGHRLAVRFTVDAPGYAPRSRTSDPTDVVIDQVLASMTVTTTGGTRVGQARVARTSLDDDASVVLTYQWQREKRGSYVDIRGPEAEQQRFVLDAPHLNDQIRVRVSATREGNRRRLASEPVRVLPGVHDVRKVRIVGKVRPGQRVRAAWDLRHPANGLEVDVRWAVPVQGGTEHPRGRNIKLPRDARGVVVVTAVFSAPGYFDRAEKGKARVRR